MKRTLRIICILLIAVLILTANTVFSVAENEDEAADMREVLTVSDKKHEKYVGRLIDGFYGSYVSYESNQTVSVYSGAEIGYAYIAWYDIPSKVVLTWVDKDQKNISSENLSPTLLDEYIPVPQKGIYGFTLTFKAESSVSELSAYTAGTLPQELPVFEEPMKGAAVMVITGYPGDELTCFGGLLPSLAAQGVPVQVVYLNHYNRERQQECLKALWKIGIKNAPIFLETGGKRSLDGAELKKNWEKNGDVSKELVNVLNGYKPSVIVTHGKTRYFPMMAETEAVYEVFTGIFSKIKSASWLKKVYLVADSGNKDAKAYSFSDGYEKATRLHQEEFASMRTFHYTPYADDMYALYHTSVGQDELGSMLENITYTPLSTPIPEEKVMQTPEPTAEPTAEPTPEPTAEPTVEPTLEPTAEPTKEPVVTEAPAAAPVVPGTPEPTPMPRLAETKTVLLPILLSLLATALLFGAMFGVRKILDAQIPVIVAVLIPVLAGAILCVGLYRAASANQRQAAAADHFDAILAEAAARTADPTLSPVPTAVPTLAPTDTPAPVSTEAPVLTPAPTTVPTAEVTEAPTATPDPEAYLYTDGEEIVEKDPDAGKWSYKSSTLSIDITQYTGKVGKLEFPYYVADVHMRVDEFRSGFGAENRNGKTSVQAPEIAQRYNAVLMFTGDNMLNMDWDWKGMMIRDGWTYNPAKKSDIMIWHPDTLTIELLSKDDISSAKLITEGGVENVISFGPIMIKDGVKATERALSYHRLGKTNPRVGIGMKEPGHFIVIVGGYRSDNPKANLGWTLVEFADLMESFGCQQAYNLDGGVSACMILMGERLNRGGSKKDWSKLRPMPDSIIFGYSPNVVK